MRTLLIIALSSILFVSCQNTQENEAESDEQLRLNNTELAESDEQLKLNDAELAEAYSDTGSFKYLEQDYVGVIAYSTEAIELDPNNADYYSQRGGKGQPPRLHRSHS